MDEMLGVLIGLKLDGEPCGLDMDEEARFGINLEIIGLDGRLIGEDCGALVLVDWNVGI